MAEAPAAGPALRPAPATPLLERVLRRDRVAVCVALAAVLVLSWAWLLTGAGMGMSAVDATRASQRELLDDAAPVGAEAPTGMGAAMGMDLPSAWTPRYAAIMLVMWWVMMIAMMLPSAAPMILLFAAVNRRQRERGGMAVPTALFAGTYLAVWGLFSLVAVLAQWALQAAEWLSPVLVSRSHVVGGALLLIAGAYQLMPLKQACLRHCRAPLAFVTMHWRSGLGGAVSMGLRHGAFCVGCCGILMAPLFVGGVMNLWWIVGLALFVLMEKVVPAGHWLGRAVGGALLAAGAGWLLAAG